MATVEEMQARLDELAKAMPPRMRRYAENLLQVGAGKRFETQSDAYQAAGYSAGTKGKTPSGRVTHDSRVTEFQELAAKIATRRAVEALEYDEAQWLWDTVTGLNMALGRTKMVTSVDVEKVDADGNPVIEAVEKEYRAVKLPAAARFSEILGKRLGILTEKKLHGEDPDNPMHSLRELANLMRGIADDAQAKGPVRDE